MCYNVFMPRRLYIILLILGISAVILAIPAFWFSYPLLEDFFREGRAASELEVDFLDIGQGDAILIKTPAGQNVLIDGGPDSTIIKRLAENLPWWDRVIDLIILTHPHDDHVSGLIDVIKRYRVERILYTGVLHSSPNYIAWLELVRDSNTPMTIVDRPQAIKLGENCELEILYPRESLLGLTAPNLNNSSIVARLVYKETSFLFTGDAEVEVEEEMLGDNIDVVADVFKVGHHGSDTSTSEEFLGAVKPGMAVIQVSEDNKFGHPSRRIIKRLERAGAGIFRNDIDGTVKIISDGASVNVQ